MKKLHRTVDVVLALTVLIVWLLILGISPMHLLVFVFSQMLLIAFLFGNVCKTLVEAIIFMFVMHPFDVGDRCVIDSVQVNPLQTVICLQPVCCQPFRLQFLEPIKEGHLFTSLKKILRF